MKAGRRRAPRHRPTTMRPGNCVDSGSFAWRVSLAFSPDEPDFHARAVSDFMPIKRPNSRADLPPERVTLSQRFRPPAALRSECADEKRRLRGSKRAVAESTPPPRQPLQRSRSADPPLSLVKLHTRPMRVGFSV